MATVVLQTVGAAFGGAIGGPFGAVIGRAIGGLAGNAIDQKLLSKDQIIEGPRLDGTNVLTSDEGSAIPKVYGRNRVAGQIIWATRFEEATSQSGGGGGKGGASSPRTRTFSYFANFAVGICEGPVSCLRRIWADGKEIDLTRIEYRFYTGREDQEPDPLIEAKQGLGNAPAYRGCAYIVFETFPLAEYGNRIPQLTFEIVRSIGKLEKQIRSMTIIPGSTEYGYSPTFISDGGGSSKFNAFNRNNSIASTDWEASIDELQAVCPNLESVSLVVAWFGTDLRAGNCQILPGVTSNVGAPWWVAGKFRSQGHVVSRLNGNGAYGGTPTDSSVRAAIRDLKARGLKVVIYPFIMMDIPQNNSLPSPYGSASQPAYPWRGEITCNPAPGKTNTADKTSTARSQLNSFAADYRSLFLHYANLAASVGGVDGFIVGSEMRGVTRVRDQSGAFPFVETLIQLASSIRSILGETCKITYAADWSEYFGYQPTDGSGDAIFNLDPLWASDDIDAIGIDNYMPLADWRDSGDPGSTDHHSTHSIEYFKANIARGEGYDWFYASSQHRQLGIRTPITDGLGEPWIYRYKDILSWWSNPHHNRLVGVRDATPTGWVPQSKPFFFTELGCPAIDKGANQPNVFYDEKSEQSAIPYFSASGRDDLMQRRFLEAHYEFWGETGNNPISSVYGGPMVDTYEIAPWAWDARPFPWFPTNTELWSDGENWHRGHWLNGRLGAATLEDLINQILIDHDFNEQEVTCDGYLEGYVIPRQSSARSALEALTSLFDVIASEENGRLIFRQTTYSDQHELSDDYLIQENDEPKKIQKRAAELELPAEAIISHASVFNNFQSTATKSRRIDGASERQILINVPAVLSDGVANQLAERRLRESWQRRSECKINLPAKELKITAGDIVKLSEYPEREWLVENVDTGSQQEISLISTEKFKNIFSERSIEKSIIPQIVIYGKPEVSILDLPLLRASDENSHLTHFAVSANPWAGTYAVYSSPSDSGFNLRTTTSLQATSGVLLNQLQPCSNAIWDFANEIRLLLSNGQLESVSQEAVLNGANTALIETQSGGYEVIQFEKAELQPDGSWVLRNLLRALLGTETEMASSSLAGSKFILFDEAVFSIEMASSEPSRPIFWRLGPDRDGISNTTFTQIEHTHQSRHQRMLSPVHLILSETINGWHITWIRRGRIDADAWAENEIPLDAQTEKYLLHFSDAAGNLIREIETSSAEYTYLNSDLQSDFPNQGAVVSIAIAQIGKNNAPGDFAYLTQIL